jgi:hypothetical protein
MSYPQIILLASQECLPPLLNCCFELLNALVLSGSSTSLASLMLSTQMVLSLINGLLSSLGRKAFGQVAVLAITTCSNFIVSESRDVLCASYSGLAVVRQIIQLLTDLAVASSSVSSSAAYQIGLTVNILTYVVSHFQDPRICAELLQPAIKAGTISVGCYWHHKSVPSSAALRIGPASIANGGDEDNNNVLPIAKLLVQLFVGSMDPGVPPHEAQEAIEGISLLVSEHRLLSVPWFQDGGCWEGVAAAVIRALMMQSHPTLTEGLAGIFDSLIKSDISGSRSSALAQGVWAYIGAEVYRCAADSGYGDRAAHFMNSAIAKYTDTSRIDAAIFIQEVVQPLAVYIAKSKDS